MILIILYILGIHYIADFILQTDWMASNKSKNNKALGAHVLVYTFFIGLMMLSPIWAIINGIIHFITDYITSRITSKLYKEFSIERDQYYTTGGKDWETYTADKRHAFFEVIGLDQLIHTSTLIATWFWINQIWF